jgi:hypothetical protein
LRRTSIGSGCSAPSSTASAEVGFDDLAILFDDMRGDVPQLAERQAAIVDIAASRSGGARIICCPSYYSDDPVLDRAFGDRPENYLEDLGRLLDPASRSCGPGPKYAPGKSRPATSAA